MLGQRVRISLRQILAGFYFALQTNHYNLDWFEEIQARAILKKIYLTENLPLDSGGRFIGDTMGAQWIEHKGKKILYVQYGGLKPDQMLDLVRQATQMILDSKSNEVLSLSDLTGCFTSKEFVDLSKKQGAISLPHTKKAAVVGITGLKGLLLKAVNEFTPKQRVPFDTVEEAKDWLVK
jgi:hypothetical protein